MPYSKEQKTEYNKKYRQKMTEEQKEAKKLLIENTIIKTKKNVMSEIYSIIKRTKKN